MVNRFISSESSNTGVQIMAKISIEPDEWYRPFYGAVEDHTAPDDVFELPDELLVKFRAAEKTYKELLKEIDALVINRSSNNA
jgi:hypothetical protein